MAGRVVRGQRILVALLLVGGTVLVRESIASASSSLTVSAPDTADAYVSAAQPKRNFGKAGVLDVAPAAYVSYLRFSLTGLPANPSITGVRLHLTATASSAGGFTVNPVPSGANWSENGVTWRNQPGYTTTVLASVTSVSQGTWDVTLPTTGYVTGNGTYNIALVGSGSQLVSLASKEAGSGTAPRLDVDVATSAPTVHTPPSITGTAMDGNTLTVVQGTWNGYPAPSLSDAWFKCDSTGGSCIGTGVSGPTLTLHSGDVNSTFKVDETATNSVGQADSWSAPTAVVAAAPPANSTPPTVSGTPSVGQVMSASQGIWTGTTPMNYAYAWQHCTTDGSTCTPISGASSSTYTVVSSDVGSALAVKVTASNSAGSASAMSAPTAAVTSTTSSSDPVIAAAGDIACDPTSSSFNSGNGSSSACRMLYTSNLIVNNPSIQGVLDLGDNQYYCGSLTAFQESYDLSWGRFKSITHPSVGNHEYLTSGGTGCDSTNAGAAGYLNYFGSAATNSSNGAPYYSYDIGAWHLISLDSNCSEVGGCSTTSTQGKWLANDLSTHTNKCVLAYWHIPLYSSGGRASSNMQSIWNQLYNAGADVVLSGHDHIYERFAPQDAYGTLDTARGLREFIAGTGGANHTSIATVAANSEVRNATTFGVLELTLHSTSYDWKFVPEAAGTFTDSGSQACH